MVKRFDWDKAIKLKSDLRDPRNVARLDRAADNFLDHQTLSGKPKLPKLKRRKKARAKSQ